MRTLLIGFFCFFQALLVAEEAFDAGMPTPHEAFQAAAQEIETPPQRPPAPADAIDIIYTWVDGADPVWRAIRNQYYNEWKGTATNFDANSKNRYRNRNELKYSLRSILAFAPWVHHIYIVTFGQRPEWLKEDPRITIVDHKEIFTNQDHLPTFNSHSIEANLHHLPDLAERYIYLNDDVLFGAPVKPEDFFTVRSKIRIHFSKHKVPVGPIGPEECAYDAAWRNTDALLNSLFGSERRFKLAHAPFPFTKDLVKRIEAQFPHVFQLVSSHKFRVPADYTLTNGLIQYYALYMNEARVGREAIGKVLIRHDIERNEKTFKEARKMRCKFLCVQDLTEKDNPVVDEQVADFFEKSWPDPAPWEKG